VQSKAESSRATVVCAQFGRFAYGCGRGRRVMSDTPVSRYNVFASNAWSTATGDQHLRDVGCVF